VCCSCREQVRDLRVQEFFRKLIVGVTAPSDLTGSIIVKILQVVKAGTYNKWLEPRNKSPVFAIPYLSLSHLSLYILHASIVYILTCLIYLCFIDIQAWVVLISFILLY